MPKYGKKEYAYTERGMEQYRQAKKKGTTRKSKSTTNKKSSRRR
jgi:hypothetical protein